MIQFVAFIMRLAGQVHAEFLEDAGIDLGEDDGRMDFEAPQVFQLIDSSLGIGIGVIGSAISIRRFLNV